MDNNSVLLTQFMQALNDGGASLPNAPAPPIPLPSPFDIVYKMRPTLPAKEQKIIDMMVKFFEIRVLMDELKNLS